MLTRIPIEKFTEELDVTSAEKSIILIPERASSDALIEKLSTVRIKQGWPHPGVFRFREFAQAIIKEADRSFSLASIHEIKIPNQAEQFLKWVEIEKKTARFKNLASSYESFQELRRFHMLDLSFLQWKEIIRQLESNSQSELKTLTEFLLTYLEWSAALAAESKTPSYWTLLNRAARILSSDNIPADPLFLSRACSRPPTPKTPKHIKVIVLSHVELYPLENVLIEALIKLSQNPSSHLELNFYTCNVSDFKTSLPNNRKTNLEEWSRELAGFTEKLARHRVSEISLNSLPKSIIHFDHHASTRLVELHQSLGRHFKLNAETERTQSVGYGYQLLKLWCDFQLRACPSFHPIIRDQRQLVTLANTFELDPIFSLAPVEKSALPQLFLELVSVRNFLSSEEKSQLESLLQSHPNELLLLLDIFFDWGYFDFLGAGVKSPRLSEFTRQSDGVFFGELNHALPLGLPAALWTHPKNFKDYFNPLNSDTLKKDIFISHELDPLIEASGVKLPRFSNDLEGFWNVLSRNYDKIYFLNEADRDVKDDKGRILYFNFGSQSLSPTKLQMLLDCPARFYFQNLLRIDESKDWDAVSLDSSLRGQWLHFVLKALFEEGLKISLSSEQLQLQFIEEILKSSLPRFFAKTASPSYQKLMTRQIPEIAHRLFAFYKDHRKLTERHFPARSIFCEQKLDSKFYDQPFRFIADRLDVTPSGDYLLWDYKTGSTNTSKLPTAIKNNFIQLPLYKELISRLPPNKKTELGLGAESKCLGFAYLSPLKRNNSVYYFTPETERLFRDLAELDQATARPLIFEETEPLLYEKVSEALNILARGEFAAEPRKKNDCLSCPARYACGRPFLAREVDDETNEDATP